MEIASIIISVFALIVSFAVFQWNKARHNLSQLQQNMKKFCNNMEKFIAFSTEHNLISFKFQIENIFHISDKEKQSAEYNNLQERVSQRKDACRLQYQRLMESIYFLEVEGSFANNEFLKWLNIILNEFFLKVNNFYAELFDIHYIAKASEKKLLTIEHKAQIENFFNNIRDLLDYNMGFSLLKRDISGYVGKLSLLDVGLFGKPRRVLSGIEKGIMKFIKELDFENAICNKDYTRIKTHYPDFGDDFDEFIEKEKKDFYCFLSWLNEK